MDFNFFISLVIAIALGVALGTGRITLDQIFKVLFSLLKLVLWLGIPLIFYWVSYMLLAQTSIGNLANQIISGIVGSVALMVVYLLYSNIKDYGLEEGLRMFFQTFSEDTTTDPAKREYNQKVKTLYKENKSLNTFKNRTNLVIIIGFIGLGLGVIFPHFGVGSNDPVEWATLIIWIGSTVLYFFFAYRLKTKIDKELKKVGNGRNEK